MLDKDVDERFRRTDVLAGTCTLTLSDGVISAYSDVAHECTVRLSALDASKTRVANRVLVLHFYPAAQGPPAIDRSELRALYTGGFLEAGTTPACELVVPDAHALDLVYPNALSIQLVRGSGLRAVRGRFVAAVPALDGHDESSDLRSVSAILSGARRYAVLGAPPSMARADEAKSVAMDMQAGVAGYAYRSPYQVQVDVQSRAHLVRIARALAANPVVACVNFVRPSVVGHEKIEIPVPKMPWPTPDQFDDPGLDGLPWRLRPDRPRPGVRPPPRPPR